MRLLMWLDTELVEAPATIHHREERQQQLERSRPRFDDLDDRLFKLDKKIDLDKKLMDYIRAKRTKFYFSGSAKNPSTYNNDN